MYRHLLCTASVAFSIAGADTTLLHIWDRKLHHCARVWTWKFGLPPLALPPAPVKAQRHLQQIRDSIAAENTHPKNAQPMRLYMQIVPHPPSPPPQNLLLVNLSISALWHDQAAAPVVPMETWDSCQTQPSAAIPRG
jgi:hypothetical protein